MKKLHLTIKKLYNSIIEAKKAQAELLNQGDLLTTTERENVVEIWNSLDIAAKSAFDIANSKGVKL